MCNDRQYSLYWVVSRVQSIILLAVKLLRLQTAKSLLLVLPCLWLTGCAGMLSQTGAGVPVVEGTGSQSPVEQKTTALPPPQPVVGKSNTSLPVPVKPFIEQPLPASSPAVLALLNNADKETLSGRTDYAAAAIERALGLEPQNALLWSRLASIRLSQGNWQQAVVLAGRSNTLARNNRSLLLQNWKTIERAKTGLGDIPGAAAARQTINRLTSGG